MAALRQALSDGRWHFQHGPMDIVIGADGEAAALASAHEAAWQRFTPLLDQLVAELPVLRSAIPDSPDLLPTSAPVQGRVARRMWAACAPYRAGFITPMAAVAGAVAQDLMDCYQIAGIDRAWVNNGGDIAFHLTRGHSLRAGLFSDLGRWDTALVNAKAVAAGLDTDAQWLLTHGLPARGMATSGWRGRSLSLGIADSVTVLAASAAQADAAATVIANAVNVQDAAIARQPACDIQDNSDLGHRLVTVQVPRLAPSLVREALAVGLAKALALQRDGLVWFAALFCQGQWCSTPDAGAGTAAQLGAPLGSVFA